MPDFLKINTDAVTFKNGLIGIGVVIRNSKGEIEYAATRKKKNSFPDLDPEFQAFMEGLYLAAGFKLRRFICESVHLNLEKMEMGFVSAIVDGLIRRLGEFVMEDLCELGVCFVSSDANRAARRLALVGKRDGKIFWEKETPEYIAAIVESERPGVESSDLCEIQKVEI